MSRKRKALGSAARDDRFRSAADSLQLDESRELLEMPPEDLRPAPWQPREAPEPEDLSGLVQSITAHGILQPLLAAEDEDGTLILLAGHRRREAAILAGLDRVPVRALDVSGAMAVAVTLAENLAREDLSAWEEARGLASLRDALAAAGEKPTRDRLAAVTGRSGGAVSTALRIADRLGPVIDDLAPRHRHAVTKLPKAALHNASRRSLPPARAETLMRALHSLAAGEAPGRTTAQTRGRGPKTAPYSLEDRLDSSGRLTLRVRRVPEEFTPAEARQLLDRVEPFLARLRDRGEG